MSIKFMFIFQILLFITSIGLEIKRCARETMKASITKSVTKFHSGLDRISNDWRTKVKSFLEENKSRMKRTFARSEFNTGDSNLTAPYESSNIVDGVGKLPAFDDPFFTSQFYMVPAKRAPGHMSPYDINVLPVWMKDKNFGENIKIMILEDGVDTTHPELKDNFDSELKLDSISDNLLLHYTPANWGDNTPTIYEGTKVAGIIAMKANNKNCGVGVAPRAKFGIIRFKSPTNEDFAKALLFKMEEVDIFFTSWAVRYADHALSPYIGPMLQAYEHTAIKGRGGKGVIHVVPIGNEGNKLYMCGSNVILQSIYTIGVTGSEYDGSISDYSEYCASVMVSAYSSFGSNDRYMTVVPDINDSCTRIHGGSGTAAALVAGVIALTLNARPSLTWREIQHAIVWTSEVSPLQHDPFLWKMNGAGFYVSEFFGFGMINAYNLVSMAKSMKHIPPMVSCVEAVYDYACHPIPEYPSKKVREYKHQIAHCSSTEGNTWQQVNYIEHVQLRVSLVYASKRGDIVITLKSPSGTQVTLLDRQPDDHSTKGILEWYFDSVMMWGESPEGEWRVKIAKHFSVEKYTPEIYVQRVYLLIHGTQAAPPHYTTFDKKRKFRPYKKPVPSYLPPRLKKIME